MKMIIAVLISLLIEIALIVFRKKLTRHVLHQIIWLDIFLLLFYVSALLSPTTDKSLLFWLIIEGWTIIEILITSSILYFFNYSKESEEKNNANHFVSKDHVFIIILVFITILSRVWLLNTAQSWDSSEYYYVLMRNCGRFNFSPSSFLDSFTLLDHPTFGFGFWAAIGEFLFPQKIYGVLGVFLALTCAASICLYKLFRYHWTELRPGQAFVGVLLCFCNPLVLAGFCCVMPDYLMAIFTVFLIYSDSKKDYILAAFWGIMVAFCKEIGMIIVATYFAVKGVCIFFSNKGNPFKRCRIVFSSPSIWSGLTIGLIIIIYFLYNRSVSVWAHSAYYTEPMTWSGVDEYIYNTFGIQKDNIITRVLEFFIVNFGWLISGMFVVGLFAHVFFPGRCSRKLKATPVLEVIGLLTAYALFMFLYITAGSMRYNIIFILLFTAVSYVFFASVFTQIISIVVGIATIALLCVQSFSCFDVVTNILYPPIDVGGTSMLCVSQRSHLNPGGDYYITNLQYRSIHENFKKMFQAVGLRDEDVIIVAGDSLQETRHNSSVSSLNGRHNDMIWDPETGVYSNAYSESPNTINVINTNTLWNIEEFPSRDDQRTSRSIEALLSHYSGSFYVYFSPLFQSDDTSELFSQLNSIFYFSAFDRVYTAGNGLSYCELVPKPIEDWDISFLDHEQYIATEEEKWYQEQTMSSVDFEGTRREIKAGDTVYVSIICFENGQFVNMGTSPKGVINRTLTIGCGYYLDNLDQQLIGRHLGDTVTVECEVPEDYRNAPEIAGKELTLKIKLLSIRYELPE